ncbi:MAG: hypothetical protein HQK51_15000, partial [Oligoflexia bacterium]|nr:hypothetical protein [Oligoflexia bacterium]
LPYQEGNVFEYLKDSSGKVSSNRPNNAFTGTNTYQAQYIGFNEIYGSVVSGNLLYTNTPKVINLKEGKLYDIFTNSGNSGAFSPCTGCGNDYYSSLNKIFPENFKSGGGGYMPDPKRTSRWDNNSGIEGNYRADDLLFGRACFVPATMIPWSHRKRTSIIEQRKYRLAAQHTLFANGYQRDWYGFDYGALIGSFDGVAWFAIGDSRRVKAQSNKLFLAFNAYFSDLTTTNNVSVTVKETTGVVGSGSNVSLDFDSDGAECQKYHLCETDQDCVAQVGWEYSCQPIGDIQTNWPYFDVNANEIPNAERTRRIVDILVGGTQGVNKRCVYRGRGVPCVKEFFSVNATQSYSGNNVEGLHACQANYYCQSFTNSDGKFASYFNDRISRYGGSVVTQNNDDLIEANDPSDQFGIGARVIGRPYSYNGNREIDSETIAQLAYNRVGALCIPGRDVSDYSMTYEDQNKTRPTNTNLMGDKVLGIGMSYTNPASGRAFALSACSILDNNGNYIHSQKSYESSNVSGTPSSGLTLEAFEIPLLSGSQALSTDLLQVFQNYSPVDDILVNAAAILMEKSYQKGRCLRAAGSACFSDFDCGPNEFISNQVTSLETQSTTINDSEYNYWTEPLICGQLLRKSESAYDLKKNRCCRDVGGTMEINTKGWQVNLTQLAGINIGVANSKRYSRIAPIYYYMRKDHPKYNNNLTALAEPTSDDCGTDKTRWGTPNNGTCVTLNKAMPQFITLNELASKTCCGGHWVRHFDSDISSGHKWESTIHQELDASNFKCIDFEVAYATPDDGISFGCEHDSQCNVHKFTEQEINDFSNFFGSLELMGIPQVAIKSTHHFINPSKSIGCYVATKKASGIDIITDDQTARPRMLATPTMIPDIPVPGTTKIAWAGTAAGLNPYTDHDGYPRATAIPEFIIPDGPDLYFSAGDYTNFDSSIKPIFSSNQFSCCLPAGTYSTDIVNDKTGAKVCCTGVFIQVANNSRLSRCCLPKNTNVSVYISRYVSSEAGDVSVSQFDPYTGILPAAIVEQIAKDKNLCCSSRTGYGQAVTTLDIPGIVDSERLKSQFERFLFRDIDTNYNLYNQAFQRWKTHIYCK